MFWGLILKASKRYSQTVTKSFHLSQAALDTSTCGDDDVQVMLSVDDSNYLLCTLKKGSNMQCALDLNFQEGDKIAFASKGSGCVHLTGYLQMDEGDFMDSDMDDEEFANLQENDIENMMKEKQSNKKKKEKVPQPEPEDSDDEDDGEEEEDDDEEEEDSDEQDQPSEEESVDEEVEEPKQKIAKVEKPKQNGIAKKPAKEIVKDKKKENVQTDQKKKSPKGKTLAGGVQIEDLKVGAGKEAKKANKVQVYYEGRLQNNKVFDASKSGLGFKFTLGKGQVISGWDIGVAGMKVGGKRRITCPPAMAYGAKGSPPVIPPNSTLIFDVELRNVF